MSVIAPAVAPLKNAAIDHAVEFAHKRIAFVVEQLEAAGWDLRKAAPYPQGTMSRNQYRAAAARLALFSRLITHTKPSHRCGEPVIVVYSPEGAERFIAQARADAALEFDAYVSKLEGKVGEVTSAEIDGRWLWQGSILTVTKATGTERWKTTQIVNCSGLGTLYNQWPTRLLKGTK